MLHGWDSDDCLVGLCGVVVTKLSQNVTKILMTILYRHTKQTKSTSACRFYSGIVKTVLPDRPAFYPRRSCVAVGVFCASTTCPMLLSWYTRKQSFLWRHRGTSQKAHLYDVSTARPLVVLRPYCEHWRHTLGLPSIFTSL